MNRVCLGGAVVSSCAMLRIQLPVFPASSCAITPELAFEQREGVVVYFNGHLPVFSLSDHGPRRLPPLLQSAHYQWGGLAGPDRPRVWRAARHGQARLPEAAPGGRGGLLPAACAARLGVLPNTLNQARHAGRLKKSSRHRGSRSRVRPARVAGGGHRRRRCCPGPCRHGPPRRVHGAWRTEAVPRHQQAHRLPGRKRPDANLARENEPPRRRPQPRARVICQRHQPAARRHRHGTAH